MNVSFRRRGINYLISVTDRLASGKRARFTNFSNAAQTLSDRLNDTSLAFTYTSQSYR